MKEAQRHLSADRALDNGSRPLAHQPALMEVPIGHVQTGIARDVDAVEESGHEVDPLLVDEQPGAALAVAKGEAAPLPPVEQAQALSAVADADEAEVIGPVVEQILLGG